MEILSRVESAITNYLSSSFTGSATIYRGTEWREQNEEGDLENTIIVYASGAEPLLPGFNSANWHVHTLVYLRVPYNGDETETTALALQREIQARILDGNLTANISGSGLSVYEITETETLSGIEGDCYASNTTLNVSAYLT